MRCAITLLACLLNLLSQAQVVQDNFSTKFIKYLAATLPEKVYLQTDKPYYLVEDTIWLKAYAVNAQIHQPSPSNFVYVELINQLDSVQSRIKIRKDSTGFQGYIYINKRLIPGEYALRAYTNWMRNEPSEYFFQRNITIERGAQNPRSLNIEYKPAEGNKIYAIAKYTYSDGSPIPNCRIDFSYNKDGKNYQKKQALTDDSGRVELGIQLNATLSKQILTANIYDSEGGIIDIQKFITPQIKNDFEVQFFPESGILLYETPQVIAFKAIGSDGLGVQVNGKIVTQGGNTVAEITTQYNGMGKFFLYTQKDTIYYTVIEKDGVEKKFKLPEAQTEGVVLSLNRRGESCFYSFDNRTPYPTDNLLLITHTRGIVSMVLPLHEQKKSGKFSLEQRPEGILNVAIINRTGDVLCERMMYVKRGEYNIPEIITNSLEYKLRDKVELTINTHKQGRFALSVTDAEIVKQNPLANNIVSHLLMTSELKGYIETPGYYFMADNNEVNGHLDLLMLTQGWRRYDLSAILQQRLPKMKEPLELGQSLTGKVKPVLWNKMEGIEVIGFTNKWQAVHATLDTSGNYAFNGIEFTDSTAFNINAINKKGKAKGIMIYPDPEIFPKAQLFIPNQHKEKEDLTKTNQNIYIQNEQNMREVTLDDITVTAKYISKTGKLAGEFAAHADYIVTDQSIATKYRNKTINDIIDEAIIQRFPGINLATTDTLYYRGKPIQIVVDTKNIELHELQFYMASEIASISFFKDASEVPFYMPVINKDRTETMDLYKGVILIELKEGGTAHYFRPSIGLATLYPLGYQKPVEFYSPKYDASEVLLNSNTDYRTTVYWNPCIQTDSTGHAKIYFYTTDMKHDMEYVLEGISEEGMPCRATGRIKAKKE